MTSESVRVSVHRKPSCRIELHVSTGKSIVDAARKEAIKAVNKEVSLPGFRKGKAPEDIILKKFPNDVERKLHKAIADLAFIEAQKISNVPLLNNNSTISFDLKKHSDEGAELVFTFETEPKIPAPDPKLFSPKSVDRPEVGDKQIDEAIRQMMFFYAQWTPIEDRPVREGDFIMIDLDTVEGETSQKVFHHIRFEVVPERMAAWMRNLVLNAKAGDVLEGMSEPDDNASEEEKKEFKPKKVRLHLLKVEQAVLPELNDEFAKKVGAPDVAAMRQSITSILNQKADEKVQTALRDQVNDFLVEQYPFELPLSPIETEKKHRHQQLLKDPKFRKNWDSMSQDERKKIEEKLTEESTQAVRLFYLSRQVVHNAKIPITHKEVQDEAVATLNAYGVGRIEIDKISKEVYALALSKVILSKAQDHIIQAQKA
jgi:trigger factor